MKIKQQEYDQNLKRLTSNLEFSQDANRNLKNDYDLLQDKFDKHMKATNNLNMDLKEEIEQLNAELGKLRIFKDDHDELIKEAKVKMEKAMEDTLQAKEVALNDSIAEKNKISKELDEFKAEYTRKMNQVKLLEMELEQKLAAQVEEEYENDNDFWILACSELTYYINCFILFIIFIIQIDIFQI